MVRYCNYIGRFNNQAFPFFIFFSDSFIQILILVLLTVLNTQRAYFQILEIFVLIIKECHTVMYRYKLLFFK